jgi:hypothetical protein
MDVTYGADYSAGELSPAELDRFTTYDLRFLLRYTGPDIATLILGGLIGILAPTPTSKKKQP